MRMTLGRDSFAFRLLATGALLGLAALAGCGNSSSLYEYDAPAAVVVADFNGSGYPGMAVAQAQINELKDYEQPGYVALVMQNTSSLGNFEPSVHFPTEGNPSAMAVGEFTPGSVDLAVANVNDQSISVLLETSPNAASFKAAINVPAGPASSTTTLIPYDVAICDVNGDGYPDIVVAYEIDEKINNVITPVGGGVNVILQNPSSPGTFEPAQVIGSTPLPSGYQYPNSSYGVACANLSGDTTAPPDIVITSFSAYDDTLYYNEGTVSIFYHDPSNPGSFLPRYDISVPGALHRVVIADVNGDGLPDIIVGSEQADSSDLGESGVALLVQNKPAAGATQPSFPAAPTYIATYSATSIAVGDLTGDGLNDIVVSSIEPTGTGSINVLLNTKGSAGTFQSPVIYAGLGNPAAVAIGNLDGNTSTLPDIATADATGAAVMFNETSSPGTFEASDLVGG